MEEKLLGTKCYFICHHKVTYRKHMIVMMRNWLLYPLILSCLFQRLFVTCRSSISIINVARNKPTGQSGSSGEKGFYYSSHLAVDGNNDTDFSHKSCTESARGKTAYWYVDLQRIYSVRSVTITNRAGEFGKRMKNFVIFGTTRFINLLEKSWSYSYPNELNDITECGCTIYCQKFRSAQIRNGATENIKCRKAINVRYLYIVKANGAVNIVDPDDYDNLMNLCEVVVNAAVYNIARNKPTGQSSTYGQGYSHLAVDGSRNNRFGNATPRGCTHTGGTNPAWWYVDLLITYKVFSVTVTNRGDGCETHRTGGCGFRLRKFAIIGSVNNITIPSEYNDDNRLNSFPNTQHCLAYHNNSVTNGDTVSFTCQRSMTARFVYIIKSDRSTSNQYLSLCEVEVEGVCTSGFYGLGLSNPCTGTCANCKNSNCDMISGKCKGECDQGYWKFDGTCVDVNECYNRPCPYGRYCYNFDGYYICGLNEPPDGPCPAPAPSPPCPAPAPPVSCPDCPAPITCPTTSSQCPEPSSCPDCLSHSGSRLALKGDDKSLSNTDQEEGEDKDKSLSNTDQQERDDSPNKAGLPTVAVVFIVMGAILAVVVTVVGIRKLLSSQVAKQVPEADGSAQYPASLSSRVTEGTNDRSLDSNATE